MVSKPNEPMGQELTDAWLTQTFCSVTTQVTEVPYGQRPGIHKSSYTWRDLPYKMVELSLDLGYVVLRISST